MARVPPDMNKIISLVFLVAGLVLLGYGINANHSLASGVSKAFTGIPSDKALLLIVGGGVLAAIGLAGFIWPRRTR